MSELADTRPVLRVAPDALPLHVMSAAKRVAVRHFWLLSTWVQFSDEARATLSADASPESLAKFHEVVAKWFRVELTT